MYFTVVTPSYQQGKYIEATIRSILAQKEFINEYYVFDGGSTDNTVSILEKYSNSINWISERDGGQAAAVNKGLRRAKGTYIAWINSDDILYAGALEIVSKVFEEHPEVDIVYGKARHIDINGSTIEHYPTQEWDAKLLDKV